MTDQKPWRLEDLAFESMGDDEGKGHDRWCRDRETRGKVLDQLPSRPVVEP
jgi:hypothetical protein